MDAASSTAFIGYLLPNDTLLRRDLYHLETQASLPDDRLTFDISHQSLTQIILTELPLDRVGSLRIDEITTTPGSVEGLELYQTTRLRAIGTVDGREIDLTDTNVVWTSSAPDIIRVYQGGLVQRIRDSAQAATIYAKTSAGEEAQPVAIPPSL